MEKNKKSPRWGGEGRRPIVYVMPKSNGKQAPPLSFAITPTVTRKARHSPPSPLRKKSRFAKKKSAPPKKNTPIACRTGTCMATRRRLVGIQPLVGGLPFWVFCAPILWRRWVSTDFSVTIQLCNNMGALSVGMLF